MAWHGAAQELGFYGGLDGVWLEHWATAMGMDRVSGVTRFCFVSTNIGRASRDLVVLVSFASGCALLACKALADDQDVDSVSQKDRGMPVTPRES
jgi:hypothetical protein